MTVSDVDIEPSPPAAASSASPSRKRPIVLVVVLAVLIAGGAAGVLLLSGNDPGTVHRYLVPKGTGDRIANGYPVAIIPDVLRLRQGDKMVIENQDAITHIIGPYSVRPGETLNVTYTRVGVYPGPCSFTDDERVVIAVT